VTLTKLGTESNFASAKLLSVPNFVNVTEFPYCTVNVAVVEVTVCEPKVACALTM
jgi:hypothetical protein